MDWSTIFNIGLFQNTLRTATPVILAGLGCLMTDHVGIMNIGVDGMMLVGAFAAVLGSYFCSSWAMGLVFAIVIYLTDNLSVSILLHMLFNAFTVIITCFEKSNAIQAILQCNIAGYTLFNP